MNKSLSPEELNYYSRQLVLKEVGLDGQLKLKDASVLVVGLGGLGAPLVQSLAGMGVGTIGLADFDKVSLSNLHRQSIYTFDDVGRFKTEVAKEYIHRYNPFVRAIGHHALLTTDNVLEVIEPYDIVVDGTDNLETKYLLNDACVYVQKPLVYGSVHKWEGNIAVFNTSAEGPTLRCLFPELSTEEPSCSTSGVMPHVTAVTAGIMCSEVVHILLHGTSSIENQLLIFDSSLSDFRKIRFEPTFQGRKQSKERLELRAESLSISPMYLHQLIHSPNPPSLIDVRTEAESQLASLGGVLIPHSEVEEHLHMLDRHKEYILYCHHGIRSMHAMDMLRQHGFTKIKYLVGGIHAYSIEADDTIPTYSLH